MQRRNFQKINALRVFWPENICIPVVSGLCEHEQYLRHAHFFVTISYNKTTNAAKVPEIAFHQR
jgi:hypothetical protein